MTEKDEPGAGKQVGNRPASEPTRQEFIELLDCEIRDARAAGEAGGWTQWALAAALATILALLGSTWESGKIHITTALSVFVVAALIYSLVRDLRRLGVETPEPPRDVRFHLLRYYSDRRGEDLALSFLWLVSFASVWYLGDRGADRPYRILAYSYFAFFLLLEIAALVAIVFSMDPPLEHPAQARRGPSRAFYTGVFWVARTIAVVALIGFVSNLEFLPSGESIRDTRAGVLAVVAIVLLVELAERRTRGASALAAFSAIHRDLMLGYCDLAAAVSRFEERTLGVPASRVLEQDITQASQEFDRAESVVASLRSEMARLSRNVEQLERTPEGSEDEAAQLRACMSGLAPLSREVKAARKDFRRHMKLGKRYGNRAFRRAVWALRSDPRAGPALRESIRVLQERTELLEKQFDDHYRELEGHEAKIDVLHSRVTIRMQSASRAE